MARVLIPEHKQWYHELKSIYSYREADVERFVCQHAGSIFSDFYVFPFKLDVRATGSSGAKRPDLAMIRKDLSGWGVIEVELDRHQIKHVLDQVGVFVNATYNTAEVAEYLKIQLESHCHVKLKLPQLRKLCRDTMPRVIVLVDSYMEKWEPELEKVGVELCTFEIYKDARGVHVFRALGKYPIVE